MEQERQRYVVFLLFLLFGKEAPPLRQGSYRRRTGASLTQGVEKILGRHPLHVRWPVSSNCLRGRHVTLAAALDLIEDDTSNHNQENTAKRAAERNQDDNPVGMVVT